MTNFMPEKESIDRAFTALGKLRLTLWHRREMPTYGIPTCLGTSANPFESRQSAS